MTEKDRQTESYASFNLLPFRVDFRTGDDDRGGLEREKEGGKGGEDAHTGNTRLRNEY